jgi:hypothetical protein
MNVLDQAKAFIRRRRTSTSVPTNSGASLSLENLAQLSLEEKVRYVQALVPIALASGRIGDSALARLYQLFAMTELSQNNRLEILREVFLRGRVPGDSGSTFYTSEIQLSLAKDAIALSDTTSSSTIDVAQNLLQRLKLTPGQIDFLHTWIDWENRIMDKIGRGDLHVRSEDLPTELLSKATAVGVPLTALYFSGSVVGFGAAGITSGLATIGSASLLAGLGLNPMTAGIAALIVGGIAIKKLLDAILPNTREDAKRLEHSLELMRTIRRRYRDYLHEDIRAFAVGPWWERFSGRGSTRREAVGRLQQLADAEKQLEIMK